ncbi:uncharacterized [Tachysurus ichikawai]
MQELCVSFVVRSLHLLSVPHDSSVLKLPPLFCACKGGDECRECVLITRSPAGCILSYYPEATECSTGAGAGLSAAAGGDAVAAEVGVYPVAAGRDPEGRDACPSKTGRR